MCIQKLLVLMKESSIESVMVKFIVLEGSIGHFLNIFEISQFYRNIFYELLPNAFPDMDCALYWFCKEAAADINYNLSIFHSAKFFIEVIAQYETANPETLSSY